MKKFILLSLVLIGLTSCNMQFYDRDGFAIFGLGAVLDDNQVLVQSHYGYLVVVEQDGEHIEKIFKENKFYLPTEICNVTNAPIRVKITLSGSPSYWQYVAPNSSLTLGDNNGL